MKYLVAGLGNIGDEYARTRHNVGFLIVDAWAKSSSLVFQHKRYGEVAECTLKGRQVVLLKPSTYMNMSGKAVRYWLQNKDIPVSNLLVVVDDIALPFGRIRIRLRGSDGGHNGLASIIEALGHQEFARLRFGIGNHFDKGKQIDYVLGEWTPEEWQQLPPLVEKAVEAIKSFCTAGPEKTMSIYNS